MRVTKQLVAIVGLLIGLQACAVAPRTGAPAGNVAVAAGIRAVLTTQAAAWNRGDIPGFMQGY